MDALHAGYDRGVLPAGRADAGADAAGRAGGGATTRGCCGGTGRRGCSGGAFGGAFPVLRHVNGCSVARNGRPTRGARRRAGLPFPSLPRLGHRAPGSAEDPTTLRSAGAAGASATITGSGGASTTGGGAERRRSVPALRRPVRRQRPAHRAARPVLVVPADVTVLIRRGGGSDGAAGLGGSGAGAPSFAVAPAVFFTVRRRRLGKDVALWQLDAALTRKSLDELTRHDLFERARRAFQLDAVILLEQRQDFLAGRVQQFSDFIDPDCGQRVFLLACCLPTFLTVSSAVCTADSPYPRTASSAFRHLSAPDGLRRLRCLRRLRYRRRRAVPRPPCVFLPRS